MEKNHNAAPYQSGQRKAGDVSHNLLDADQWVSDFQAVGIGHLRYLMAIARVSCTMREAK